MDKAITLIIADDHPVFRRGLRDIIESKQEFRVAGEAENGECALKLIEEVTPQIAVIDIEMPVMDGFDLVKALHARHTPIDIIFLTMYKEEDIFNKAMDLGVRGYVLKESAVHDILESLRIVAAGGYYISPLLTSYLVNRNDCLKEFHARHPSIVLLTLMERKVLRLIAENKTSRDIGEELCISWKTVENHRNNIANKLNLHGPHQLLNFALENKSHLM